MNDIIKTCPSCNRHSLHIYKVGNELHSQCWGCDYVKPYKAKDNQITGKKGLVVIIKPYSDVPIKHIPIEAWSEAKNTLDLRTAPLDSYITASDNKTYIVTTLKERK